ncbi:MAG: hypothetical protein ACK5O2_02305 [Microthrixaceae bacterium]
MALIRATCSDCGDVELRSRDLKVRMCRTTGAATYLFRCPSCAMIEVRPAESHVVDVLLAAGVSSTEWDLPSELHERVDGPVITHDDVLDFHDMLNGTDWFSTLASMTER